MIEKVKKDILSFLRELNLDVGHAFPVKPFSHQRAKNYSPPELDAIESALDELVSEGMLEQRDDTYFLTKKGLDRIYPGDVHSARESVKSDIKDFLREMKLRAGDVLPAKPFAHQRLAKYNPKQKSALDDALSELVSEDVLEKRDEDYFVTETGYKEIYGL